ncbi:MAG: hypothetical protein PHN78_00875, partial [Dehalococcoidales bacterium]|nr:hypothetical protein [Dehalococcoidales bacterium]
VLALLALGGLTIATSLNYVTNSLKAKLIIDEGISGLYAADAGLEDAIWSLRNSAPPPQQLVENINQMHVTIETEASGNYTLCLGEMVPFDVHNIYLDVQGVIVWDEQEQAYKYTVTITWQPGSGTSVIHISEIGARLPPGYSYQAGSAAMFQDNTSTSEPDEYLDGVGAHMVNWVLGSPSPSVSQNNPVLTQAFYITGEGELEGDYAWVVADRSDIGAVGELTGGLYTITATATRPEDGKITGQIVAEVMVTDDTYITSWQVLH